jgi:predicted nucleotidyltransferase
VNQPDRATAKTGLLQSIAEDVRTRHKCHTLILYGSWARGDATPTSDYDLLAIRQRGRAVVRDARMWEGAYLDIFVYPEEKLRPDDLLQVRGGKVLFQRGHIGDALLARIDKVYARGPKPLSHDEIGARRLWAQKMFDRLQAGDPEGNYRRVWLLTALLEDYFELQNRWYEGPKAAFKWLRTHRPHVCAKFENALMPGADLRVIGDLIAEVLAVRQRAPRKLRKAGSR